MAFVSIDDGHQTKDITIFSSTYAEIQDWLKVGCFVAFETKIEPDRRGAEEYGNSMLAEGAYEWKPYVVLW